MPIFKNPGQKFTVLFSIMLAMYLLWEKGLKNYDWSKLNIQNQTALNSTNATLPVDNALLEKLLLRVEILEKEVQLLKK